MVIQTCSLQNKRLAAMWAKAAANGKVNQPQVFIYLFFYQLLY